MVILDLDHPDIEEFINWKVKEEQKVAAMVSGSKINSFWLDEVMRVANEQGTTDYKANKELGMVVSQAVASNVPVNYVIRALQLAGQGEKSMSLPVYDTHYESEAYVTVSGQNSNNSVRIPNKFMRAVEAGGAWPLVYRTSGQLAKTLDARKLWDEVAYCAWASADPGVQFDDTINEWHTCPVDGKINATNPCVTGDTLVLTSGGSWKRIDSLLGKEAELVTNLNSISVGATKGAFATGLKPVYKLETKSGYEVKLTADHAVYTVNRGFVKAAELSKDDLLCLPGQQVAQVLPIPQEKARFFQLIGLYLGDGCGSGGKIALTMDKQLDAPVLQAMADYCTRNFVRKTHQHHAMQVMETATSGKLNIVAQSAVGAISEYVDLTLKSPVKVISDKIFGLSLSEQKFVLQGLFTADGTVADYGEKSQYVSLDSTSLPLLKGVQVLLSGFGIKSKIYQNRRAGKHTTILPDGQGWSKEYEVLETHSLRVTRSSRVKFEGLVGFMAESYKAQALHALNQKVSVYSDSPYDYVKSLEFLGQQPVFDLTEPLTNSFVANGLSVHNCSEYIFLDETSCNLASLNLMKFYDTASGLFDVPKFLHSARLWTIVLEISVLMAAFPGAEMARRSYAYRTLGLGFANLGTLLMVMGIPYDSDEGRAIAGALTAILCGKAYATSAEMAKALGPFEAYSRNREHMLKVVRNHRRAAYDAQPADYEGLTITPIGVESGSCQAYLVEAARRAWDAALEEGTKHGYRNAQATVVAPTGTIALVMDCDTTGVEPDFAMVKYKKLAGGGYLKIVNQSVSEALRKLGYNESQIKDIELYAVGCGTLQGAPYVLEKLRERGFTDEKIALVEAQLKTAFDITFAFNKYVLGEDFISSLGISKQQMDDPKFNLLRALGLTRQQIGEANDYVCGTMCIEGAPHLSPDHYAVFDCASKCGKKGRRFIPFMAHVKMMAAVQPFISGGISKTINMPNEATLDDVKQVYSTAWKLMVKCIAIYRDSSKLSQPLNTTTDEEDDELSVTGSPLSEDVNERAGPRELQEKIVGRAMRMKLPQKRRGFVQEARVGGHKVFLRTGEYRGRQPRGDLHRHVQGRHRLPLADELLCNRRLQGPAVRRAA